MAVTRPEVAPLKVFALSTLIVSFKVRALPSKLIKSDPDSKAPVLVLIVFKSLKLPVIVVTFCRSICSAAFTFVCKLALKVARSEALSKAPASSVAGLRWTRYGPLPSPLRLRPPARSAGRTVPLRSERRPGASRA